MKNILVTGGAGFIGTYLIKELLDRFLDHQIISVDNYSTGKVSNHDSRARYLATHTGNMDSKTKEDITHIFHFGEYSRIATSFEDSCKLVASNLAGTANVLELWKETGATLIYSGSSSIFADPNANPYTYSKFHNVQLIKNYAKWFDLPYVITYFYNVYGPGQIDEGRMSTVIGIFLKQYREGKPLTIVGDGTQRRDFTHVEDIVSGIMAAVESPNRNEEYHLCTGFPFSINDLVQAFPDDVKIEYVPERRGERFDSTGMPTKANEELGWQAQYNVLIWIAKQLQDGV